MAINTVVAALRGGCNVNYEAADTIEELQKTIDLRNNVMGRIAISLFGEQNNRTDEECVAAVEALKKERDAAFKMSKCECSPDECCANLVKAWAERDRVQAELTNLQIAFNDWKVFHSTARLEAELAGVQQQVRNLRDAGLLE